MLFVGVDLGTSAVKLLLMDENGKIKNIVSKEYPLYFPHPGWSEQKPEDWYAQTMDGIKALIKDVDKSQVAGISFGGQMHGLVVLDENDAVIRLCPSETPQMESISFDQRLCCTSSSSMPEASDTSVQNTPVSL